MGNIMVICNLNSFKWRSRGRGYKV